MFIPILIILGLIIATLLMSSIKIRFRFDDQVKRAGGGYLFAFCTYDFILNILIIQLFAWDAFKIDIRSKEKPDKKKQKAAKKPKAKESKKWYETIFKRSNFKIKYVKWGFGLFRKVRINYLDLNISGGFYDPYYTGNTTAIYWIAKGIAPRFMSHITFNPNFSADKLVYKGKGLISLKMYYIVGIALRLLTDITESKIRNISLFRSKGVSYG